jgi:hypothetical protein
MKRSRLRNRRSVAASVPYYGCGLSHRTATRLAANGCERRQAAWVDTPARADIAAEITIAETTPSPWRGDVIRVFL